MFDHITLDFFIFLTIGAIAAGFINGLAGFGTTLFALGWWLQILPPIQAVALSLATSLACSIQGLHVVRSTIQWKKLPLFLIPAFLGIPIGFYLLHIISASILKITIAGFLIFYGGFFSCRKALPALTKPYYFIEITIGFLSGILGAIAGLSGALPTMWLAMRPWSKGVQRGLLQPFNFIILGISACLLTFKGIYTKDTLILFALVAPVSIISAQVGILIFKRLNDNQFRRLLIIMMFIAGIVLLIRELF